MGQMEDKLAELGVKQLVKNIFGEEFRKATPGKVDVNELLRAVDSRLIIEVRRLSDEAVKEMMAKLETILSEREQHPNA